MDIVCLVEGHNEWSWGCARIHTDYFIVNQVNCSINGMLTMN